MIDDFLREWNTDGSCITVATSGSTGKPKVMQVEKQRMLASARITCDYLGLHPGDEALLCLSTDYIAGKMMVVRSIERGLNLTEVQPSNHPLAEVDSPFALVAMIPSQVYGTLQVGVERERLSRIKNLIIGGGAIPADMERELQRMPNAVWATYGMTETLSHIALRRVNGPEASPWFTPLHGVTLSLCDAEQDGLTGRLVIHAPAVCAEPLVTNDIVRLHPSSPRFLVIGRADNVICSGGIKLHIEQMEDELRPYLSMPFCITKRADAKFGEVAVLVVARSNKADEPSSSTDEEVMNICRQHLPPYSVPKSIVHVDAIPMTRTGKIDRNGVRLVVSG